MSTLSKICVVLLVVLALVATPVFVKKAAIDKSVALVVKQLNEKSGQQQALISEANAKLASVLVANKTGREKLDARIAILVSNAASETKVRQRDTDRYVDLMGKFTGLNLSYNLLVKQLQSAKVEIVALGVRTKGILAQNEQIAKANRDLEKKVMDETIAKERFARIATERRKDIESLQSEIDELNMRLNDKGRTASSGAAAPTVQSDQVITGTVKAVQDGIASINVGRANGIREGMLLTIYRGDKFVSHLRIDLLDANESAGIILDRKLPVQQNDKVTTSLK